MYLLGKFSANKGNETVNNGEVSGERVGDRELAREEDSQTVEEKHQEVEEGTPVLRPRVSPMGNLIVFVINLFYLPDLDGPFELEIIHSHDKISGQDTGGS